MSTDLLKNRESCLVLLLLFVVLALIVVAVFTKKLQRGAGRLPGPYGLPLFGCVHLFSPLGSAHVKLAQLCSAYGPMYQIRLGSKRVLVLNSVDSAKETLRMEGRGISRSLSLFHRLTLLVQGELSASSETTLEQERIPVRLRIMDTTMAYVCANTEQFCRRVNSTVQQLTSGILATEGTAFDPSVLVDRHVANLTFRIVFGEALSARYMYESQAILHELKEHLQRAEAMLMYVDCVPFGKFLLHPQLQQLSRLIANFSAVVREICNAVHQEFSDQQSDESSLMHTLRRIDQNLWSFPHEDTVPEHLTKHVLEIFFATHRRVSTSLSWGLVLLARHPEIQEGIAEQLRVALGDRTFRLEDKATVPLLEATVLETLRLSNSIPLAPSCHTTQDTTVNGYSVPQGTSVLVNLWACSRDPKYFTCGSKFNPYRFLDGTGCIKTCGPLLNISGVACKCFGDALSKSVLILTVASIIKDFRLQPSFEPSAQWGDDGFAAESPPCRIKALRRHPHQG